MTAMTRCHGDSYSHQIDMYEVETCQTFPSVWVFFSVSANTLWSVMHSS